MLDAAGRPQTEAEEMQWAVPERSEHSSLCLPKREIYVERVLLVAFHIHLLTFLFTDRSWVIWAHCHSDKILLAPDFLITELALQLHSGQSDGAEVLWDSSKSHLTEKGACSLPSLPPCCCPKEVVLAGALTPSCTMRPKATPRGWQIGEPGWPGSMSC